MRNALAKHCHVIGVDGNRTPASKSFRIGCEASVSTLLSMRLDVGQMLSRMRRSARKRITAGESAAAIPCCMGLEAEPIRFCKAIKRLEVLDWPRELVPREIKRPV